MASSFIRKAYRAPGIRSSSIPSHWYILLLISATKSSKTQARGEAKAVDIVITRHWPGQRRNTISRDTQSVG